MALLQNDAEPRNRAVQLATWEKDDAEGMQQKRDLIRRGQTAATRAQHTAGQSRRQALLDYKSGRPEGMTNPAPIPKLPAEGSIDRWAEPALHPGRGGRAAPAGTPRAVRCAASTMRLDLSGSGPHILT
jgi:hypothetical protein